MAESRGGWEVVGGWWMDSHADGMVNKVEVVRPDAVLKRLGKTNICGGLE